MQDLATVAPAFVEMAHQIVWCSAATVDRRGRPRARVLHPLWQWQDGELVGWIATGPTPLKRAHLEQSPHISCNYWTPSQDTCVAECRTTWFFDDETRERIWDLFASTPPPVGYDPAIEATEYTTIVGLVAAGEGVALVPAGVRRLQLPNVAYVKVADADARVALVRLSRIDEPQTIVANAITELARIAAQ